MKRNLFYTIGLGLMLTALASCSNDSSLSPNAELDKTLLDSASVKNELENAIDSLYGKFNSKILYDFKATDIAFGWSSTDYKWYKPIPSGSDKETLKMVRFIKDKTYSDYPDALVKKYLPSRIFLVDSVCDYKSYSEDALVNMLQLDTHGIVVANVAPRLNDWTSENWDALKTSLVSAMLNGIYSSNSASLSDFMSVKIDYGFAMYEDEYKDPEGKISNIMYGLYTNGYVNADMTYINIGWGLVLRVSDADDLGYFLTFIFKTSKTDQSYIYSRFPLVKKRAYLLAQFVKDVLELDPVAMQNSSCPADPVPAGYFDSLNQ